MHDHTCTIINYDTKRVGQIRIGFGQDRTYTPARTPPDAPESKIGQVCVLNGNLYHKNIECLYGRIRDVICKLLENINYKILAIEYYYLYI